MDETHPDLNQDRDERQCILIADQDPMTRRSVGRAIADAGFDCQFAGDAEEATRALKERQYTLVVADLEMPDRTGIELAEEVKARYPEVSMILLASATDPIIGEMAVWHGVFGVLTKPTRTADLLVMVRSALRWKAREAQDRARVRELESSLVTNATEAERLANKLKRVQGSAYEGILLSLARAGALKDDEPEAHLKRMSNYCALLAEAYGMTPEECDRIRIASITHDIGKIGVPEAVLLKPGTLTSAEFEMMQNHTNLGHSILVAADESLAGDDPASAEVVQMAATIAMNHHERYDGSGYPMARHRDSIPLEGRIAIIADIFDAMTSRRVYRPALPVDEAVSFLRNQRELIFDPDLADLFIDRMDAVMQIRDQFPDEDASEEEQR